MKASLITLGSAAIAIGFWVLPVGPPASAGSVSTEPQDADSRPIAPPQDAGPGSQAHLDRVMTSLFCASCHPAIYAEHSQNTHGLAFFDMEARAATRGFRREDCVRCHTPRPAFETGIGITPMQRWTHLEEGNDCMSCHWKAGQDYSRFTGGAECKTAFDPRVGTVQACASCHRIGGTPDQWSRAEHGSKAGHVCIDCHMPSVERPVAVGEKPRKVRSHVFPASRSDSQLHMAESFEAKIQGNEVVVRITNAGAGHNFPTASRQRAVESLVTIRNEDGVVVGTSRLVCRYPYAMELEPGQLTQPLSGQIPSGKSVEHRVPIPIARGTVECELFFKRYRPIDDYHPLSHRLEDVRIPFLDVEPSKEPVKDAPHAGFQAPAASLEDFFDPKGFSNVARLAPGSRVTIPEGRTPQELARLVSLLEFHMPEARARARERLASLGPAAYPALIGALGDWSNETFNEAMEILVHAGESAAPALVEALGNPELRIRCNARLVLARIQMRGNLDALATKLAEGLSSPEPLDRRTAAEALGAIRAAGASAALRKLLADRDWDVVSAAAAALARVEDRTAVPGIRDALRRASYTESKRDLARALCELGAADGAVVLLDGLLQRDNLIRTSFFEAFFDVTGMHASYDPELPDAERMESLARLAGAWEKNGGPQKLRRRFVADPEVSVKAATLVAKLGGGSDVDEGGDDAAMMDELVAMGVDAVPALVEGLTYPHGWVAKRERVCETLGRLGSKLAVPALIGALRDPQIAVADWACLALERTRDAEALPAVERFQARVVALLGDPRIGNHAEWLLARAARTRFVLGDESASEALTALLLSPNAQARKLAIETLAEQSGDRRGYDPDGPVAERLAAAKRWMK